MFAGAISFILVCTGGMRFACLVVVGAGELVVGPIIGVLVAQIGPLFCIYSKFLPCPMVIRESLLYPNFNVVLPVQRSSVVSLSFTFIPL